MSEAHTDDRSALGRLLSPVRGRIVAAIVLQAAGSVLLLSPVITGTVLARVLLEGPGDGRVWSVLLIGTVLLAAGVLCQGLADLVAHLADNRFTLWVRRRLVERLSGAPLAWFSDTSAGLVKQGAQDDVKALHTLIAHSYTAITAAAVTPLVVYGYLFVVDWRLGLVMLLPIVGFAGLYAWMLRGDMAKREEYGQVLGHINSSVVEFTDGIGVVKTFGETGRASAPYREAVQRFTTFFFGWAGPRIRPETIANQIVGPVALLLLALGGGVWFVMMGWSDPVAVFAVALVGLGISGPIHTLMENLQSSQMGRGAAQRLLGLLGTPQMPRPDRPREPAGSSIEVTDVTFGYDPDTPVLHGIDCSFAPGTVTAIVGESGSGKSTLARLLLRYADPDVGSITFGGVPLAEIDSDVLYSRVGGVFQKTRLLRASIAENIALADPAADRARIEAAAKAANIHDRIVSLPRGYDSVYGEDVELSGGEAQRVCIARALLLDPQVLVLDEPTASSDAESEHAIQLGLAALLSSERTIIVIAHRLDTITGVDRILVLDDGRVIEDGTHSDLLENDGTYRRLWEAQHTTTGAQA